MVDLWFILGGTVMDPGLVGLIWEKVSSTKVFTPVNRTITEKVDEKTVTIVDNCPASGLLKETGTMALRKAIRNYLSARMQTPPISIYAVGRMAQFVQVKETCFSPAIQLAQRAYSAAVQANRWPWRSPLFPAFVGLCLVDQKLTAKGTEDPVYLEVLGEFGMTKDTQPEGMILKDMLAYTSEPDTMGAQLKSSRSDDSNDVSDFATAQGLLVGGAGWQGGCREEIIFWSNPDTFKGNDRAVLP